MQSNQDSRGLPSFAFAQLGPSQPRGPSYLHSLYKIAEKFTAIGSRNTAELLKLNEGQKRWNSRKTLLEQCLLRTLVKCSLRGNALCFIFFGSRCQSCFLLSCKHIFSLSQIQFLALAFLDRGQVQIRN